MIAATPETARAGGHRAVYWLNNLAGQPSHERGSHLAIATRVAGLKGLPFRGGYAASSQPEKPCYLVPDDTIIGDDAAQSLDIKHEDDFLGGFVPHAFIATKAITHPLITPDAAAPFGWAHDCPLHMGDAVLAGYTAFSLEDAKAAALLVLRRGPVRLKPVRARAGRDQEVIAIASELDRAIGALDAGELAAFGLVLEEELTQVTTFSVGQVRLAGLVASYWGTQRLTRDNAGRTVYGGSDLEVVRGGFDALLVSGLPAEARLAVDQARKYDAAAMKCYPGLCASRRNYDVALGTDIEGRRRCGVLEQSWRIGGATPAEIVALEAFRANPGLRAVRASSVEIYGAPGPLPPDAVSFFSGDDEVVGPITKYARIEPHESA